jgi:hypothetical protein
MKRWVGLGLPRDDLAATEKYWIGMAGGDATSVAGGKRLTGRQIGGANRLFEDVRAAMCNGEDAGLRSAAFQHGGSGFQPFRSGLG